MDHVRLPIGVIRKLQSELTYAERLLPSKASLLLPWFSPISRATKHSNALPVWNKTAAIEHLAVKAYPPYGKYRYGNKLCATRTREAIEAGFSDLKVRHPRSGLAKDYGFGLQSAGFMPLHADSKIYISGDVIVIASCKGHDAGHMAMYDGRQWISDFFQPHGFYPHHDYEKPPRTPYIIYRYSGKTK